MERKKERKRRRRRKWKRIAENKGQLHHVQHASFLEEGVLKIVFLPLIFQLMNPKSLPVFIRSLALAMSTRCFRFYTSSSIIINFLFFTIETAINLYTHFRFLTYDVFKFFNFWLKTCWWGKGFFFWHSGNVDENFHYIICNNLC